jgi:hypothetical protein
MPALSLLIDTIPGNDTSGSVRGLLLGWGTGDPSSIVKDAAESTIEVTTFLILVFIKRYGSKISEDFEVRRSGPARRVEFLHDLLNCANETLPLHNSAERGEVGSVETAKLDALRTGEHLVNDALATSLHEASYALG